MDPERTHTNLLGSSVSETQKRLYGSKTARGFSMKERDPERTDATLVVALTLATGKGIGKFNRVFIFVPLSERPWVLERIRATAITLTERVSKQLKTDNPDTKAKVQEALNHVRGLISGLQIGSPQSWDGVLAPEHWVIIGFSKEDALPGWVRDALID